MIHNDLKVVIFLGTYPICECAEKFIKEKFKKSIFVKSDDKAFVRKIKKFSPNLLISFFNLKKIPQSLLKYDNFNIHSSLPKYPGRGGSSLAIFNKDPSFGVTAHSMEKDFDSGRILKIKKNILKVNYTCEEIYSLSEKLGFKLLKEMCEYYSLNRKLPNCAKNKRWGKYMSKKDFDSWLVLNPEKKKEFKLKIKASRHSKYSGPYVIINGYKFSLFKENK